MVYSYSAGAVQPRIFGYLNCVDKLTWNPKTWFWHLIGHTARVYEKPGTRELYVYESTTLNKGVSGVQLVDFGEWLKARKDCHVYYRACTFYREWQQVSAEHWYAVHIKYNLGKPYPDLKQWRWRWYVANAAIDLDIKQLENVQQNKMIFCTQLSADLDKSCTILAFNENPSEWEPDDCREGGRLDDKHSSDVIIGPELEICYG